LWSWLLDASDPLLGEQALGDWLDGWAKVHPVGGDRTADWESLQWTLKHEPASAEDADGVTDLLHIGENVAGQQHCRTATKMVDEVKHLSTAGGVERRCRLVEQE
jgi:hypothetical protein